MSIFLLIYQYKDFFFIIYLQLRLASKIRAQHAHPTVCTGILLEHLTSLVTYIERDVLRTINNDIILVHFQQMKNILFSL